MDWQLSFSVGEFYFVAVFGMILALIVTTILFEGREND